MLNYLTFLQCFCLWVGSVKLHLQSFKLNCLHQKYNFVSTVSFIFKEFKLYSWLIRWHLKGTVGLISGRPPFIFWHVRFTTVPYKSLSDQGRMIILNWGLSLISFIQLRQWGKLSESNILVSLLEVLNLVLNR